MKDKWSMDKVFWAMIVIFYALALAIVVGYAMIGPGRQIFLVEDILKGIG